MKEMGAALKILFDKVSDFFDIFDLSFLVSGAVVVSAIEFWTKQSGLILPTIFNSVPQIILIIFSCYICGILCFAIGRWIRMAPFYKTRRMKFDNEFLCILKAHGLDNESPFEEYISRTDSRGLWRLYIRLWAEVRQKPELSPSLSLLKRYWVMAATYDGVAVSIIVWSFVIFFWCFGLGFSSQLNPIIGSIFIIILTLIVLISFREAGRYMRYQNEELVATVAACWSK